ncbi:class I SAM-dependent methyltransferase [Actinoplanes sp. CA-051413]|uniref:class I SAM-dependent methyltransferase n=1 Tax=Actinoplanes sp. CA-051413 TaxID=3239899 RepID=UPI003D992DAB
MSESYDRYRRDLWRDKAEAYRRSFASLCAHPVPLLLDAVRAAAGTRVADVGCGTGSVSEAAAARGAAVTAVDAEPGMVRATAARLPGVRPAIGALPDLPLRSAGFDAVVANFVVNHVARPAAAVAELRRVARPGGRVGVTVWPQPAPPLQRLWDEVIAAAGVTRPATPAPAPADDFPRTRDGLADLLWRAGLTQVDSRTVAWEHRVDPELWWSGAAGGLASIGHVVARQDAATVARMKAAYDRLAGAHLDSAGLLCLPTSALLAVGTVPAAGP